MNGNEILELYIDDIIPNRFQPREIFEDTALRELSISIKEHGVIQPIIVRKIGDKYEIIAGERRYKASVLAGLIKIPAIVRNLDDKESSKVALLENLQRKDLSAIEEARTYQKILELDSMTQEQLGATMGKSQAAVANKLRLLNLCDEVQDALLREKISERHARSLLNIKLPEEQINMLNRIITERMTVRELESQINKMFGQKNTSQEQNGEQTMEVETPSLQESVIDETPSTGLTIEEIEKILKTRIDEPDVYTTTPNLNQEIPDIKELPKVIEQQNIVKPIYEESETKFKFIPNDSQINTFDLTHGLPNLNDVKEEIHRIEPEIEMLEEPTIKDQLEKEKEKPADILTNVTPIVVENKQFETVKPFNRLSSSINNIRQVVKQLESLGIKVDMEEMDLSNNYQITIKINKDEE